MLCVGDGKRCHCGALGTTALGARRRFCERPSGQECGGAHKRVRRICAPSQRHHSLRCVSHRIAQVIFCDLGKAGRGPRDRPPSGAAGLRVWSLGVAERRRWILKSPPQNRRELLCRLMSQAGVPVLAGRFCDCPSSACSAVIDTSRPRCLARIRGKGGARARTLSPRQSRPPCRLVPSGGDLVQRSCGCFSGNASSPVQSGARGESFLKSPDRPSGSDPTTSRAKVFWKR